MLRSETIKDLWFVWLMLGIALPLAGLAINDQLVRHSNAEEVLAKMLEKVGCSNLENNLIVTDQYYNQKNIFFKDSQRLYDMAYKKLVVCGLET